MPRSTEGLGTVAAVTIRLDQPSLAAKALNTHLYTAYVGKPIDSIAEPTLGDLERGVKVGISMTAFLVMTFPFRIRCKADRLFLIPTVE